MLQILIFGFIYHVSAASGAADEDSRSPTFIHEPPSTVLVESRRGVIISCSASGQPAPSLEWTLDDGSPVTDTGGTLSIFPNNTLRILPFREAFNGPREFRCSATNIVGKIVSRKVIIKAVVTEQYRIHDVTVRNVFAMKSNTAVFACEVNPSYVKEFVQITDWLSGNRVIRNDERFTTLGSRDRLQLAGVREEDSGLNISCTVQHLLDNSVVRTNQSAVLKVYDPVASMPTIVYTEDSVIVQAGSTAELPCVAAAFPLPRYTWSKDDRPISLLLPSRFVQVNGNLFVQAATTEDSGLYSCTADNSYGSKVDMTRLVVTEPMKVLVSPVQQTVDASQMAELSCAVTGGPTRTIRWLKDGRALNAATDVVPRLLGSVLRLRNVTRHDAGIYQCLADGDHDNAQGSARVLLGASSPVFIEKLSERKVIPGTDVSLRCAVYGTPLPMISWMLDGVSVNLLGPRYKISSFSNADGDVISYINISRVQLVDGGQYECTAENTAGAILSAAKLLISGIPFVKPMSNITAVSRQDVVVNCRVAGYPHNGIEWHKDGIALRPSHRLSLLGGDTLKIREAEKADEGCYKCSAFNDQNRGSSQVACITVIEPPIAKLQIPGGQPPKLGASIDLTCHVTGDQPIVIEWLKDNITITAMANVEPKRVTDSTSILTVRSLSRADDGNYTCRASNTAATSSDTVALHVNVPPTWIIEPTDERVLLGGSMTLRCQCSGFPEPTIRWSRHRGDGGYEVVEAQEGGRVMVFSNGSLHLQQAEESDSGDYLCHASNNVTSGISKSVTLLVNVPAYFESTLTNYTVEKGQNISIACIPRGDKPMSVVWSISTEHNGKINSSRVKVVDDAYKSVLSLSPSIREDTSYYTCTAKNVYGYATFVAQLIVTEPPDPPSYLKIEKIESRQVHLAWPEPFNGNSHIEQYIIQFAKAMDPWSGDGNSGSETLTSVPFVSARGTAYIISNLRPACQYKFRVVCSNAIGNSLPSPEVLSTTLEEAPSGPPRNIRLAPNSSTEILVTWQMPEAGKLNSAAIGFIIRFKRANSTSASVMGGFGSTQAQTVEVAPVSIASATSPLSLEQKVKLIGLLRFTRYAVAVRAVNSQGPGPWSEEVTVMTLEDVPSQPPLHVQVTAGPGRRAITVAWQTPQLPTLHGILQGYKVFLKPMRADEDEISSQVIVVSGLSAWLDSLDHYTNYSVEVLAYTRMGEGARSRPLYVRTLPAEPTAPVNVKPVPHNGTSVLVVWQSPQQPNGAIEKYIIYVMTAKKPPVNITVMVPNPPMSRIVSGLSEGVSYSFCVAAKTQHVSDYGDVSTWVQASPLTDAPARIGSYLPSVSAARHDDVIFHCVTAGNPAPVVKWIGSDGFAPLLDRSMIYQNGSLLLKRVQPSDSGNYTCMVNNAYGRDSTVTWLRVRVSQDDGRIPGSPVVYIAITTTDTVQVNWKAGHNGGSPIRGFQLEHKKEHDVWQPVGQSASNRSFTFEHLSCGTAYLFRVRSDNKVGSGPYSEVVKGSTNGSVPIAPPQSQLVSSINSTFIELDLTTWQDGGCRIEYYAAWYHVWGDSNWHLINSKIGGGEKLMRIDDLHPGTWYTIKVAAYNSAGSTETELLLATLTYEGNAVVKQRIMSVVEPALHERLYVVVPLAVSVMLVVCIALGVALYYRRRQEKRHTLELKARNLRHDITKETTLAYGGEPNKHRAAPRSPCCARGSGSLARLHRVSMHAAPVGAGVSSSPRQSTSHESRIWLLHRHASGLTEESENGGFSGVGAATDEEMNPYATFSYRNGGDYEDCGGFSNVTAQPAPKKISVEKALMQTVRQTAAARDSEHAEADSGDSEEDEIAREKKMLKEYDSLLPSSDFPPPPAELLAPIAEGRIVQSPNVSADCSVLGKSRRFASEEKVNATALSAAEASSREYGGARPNTTGPYPAPRGASALEKALANGAAGNSQSFLSSVTTVSSNHEELFTAFQNSRMNPPPPYGQYETPTTTLTSSSARPTPESSDVTEPGIRQFTQSPPLPEETRQAVCEVPIYDKDVTRAGGNRSLEPRNNSAMAGYRHQQPRVNPSEASSDATTDHEQQSAARLPRHKSPHRKPHRRKQKAVTVSNTAMAAASMPSSASGSRRVIRTPARPNRVRSRLSNDAGVGTSSIGTSGDIVESFDGGRQSYFRASSPSEGYASRTANSYLYTDTSDYASNHYRKARGNSSRTLCAEDHGIMAYDERRPLVSSGVQTGDAAAIGGGAADEELKLLDRYYRTVKDEDREKKASREYTANYTIV